MAVEPPMSNETDEGDEEENEYGNEVDGGGGDDEDHGGVEAFASHHSETIEERDTGMEGIFEPPNTNSDNESDGDEIHAEGADSDANLGVVGTSLQLHRPYEDQEEEDGGGIIFEPLSLDEDDDAEEEGGVGGAVAVAFGQ